MYSKRRIQMLKKRRGFTLIEMLITVAILGILATLLIPNAITAIQKARQKETMKQIVSLATAVTDYVTDNGAAPTQNGSYDATDEFYDALSPFYIKVLPINDQWGNNFMVYCGADCDGNYGISGAAGDDFIIASYGRAGELETDFSFDINDTEAGMYVVSEATHFNRDLVMWNGSWIRAPRTASTGT